MAAVNFVRFRGWSGLYFGGLASPFLAKRRHQMSSNEAIHGVIIVRLQKMLFWRLTGRSGSAGARRVR